MVRRVPCPPAGGGAAVGHRGNPARPPKNRTPKNHPPKKAAHHRGTEHTEEKDNGVLRALCASVVKNSQILGLSP